jgi:hypothetical protein
MVGQLIRAAEAPISLSISVARKGVDLAGRVAGWALTEIMHGLSPGRDDGIEPTWDEQPAEPASTSTWEPASVDVTEEDASISVIDEEREAVAAIGDEPEAVAAIGDEPEAVAAIEDEPEGVAVIEEEPEGVAVIEEEPEGVAVIEEEPEAVSPGEQEPAVVSPSEEEREAAQGAAEEETEPEPVGRAAAEPPPVGGEDGAVVEHEPGIGTSVRARTPHSALNNPITEADLTEWPDPYEHREDPRDPGEEMVFGGEGGHTQTGATSTSEPHPSQDPEAEAWEGPKRDKVDR